MTALQMQKKYKKNKTKKEVLKTSFFYNNLTNVFKKRLKYYNIFLEKSL